MYIGQGHDHFSILFLEIIVVTIVIMKNFNNKLKPSTTKVTNKKILTRQVYHTAFCSPLFLFISA